MRDVFGSLGITPIVNAAGSLTTLSASPIASDIAEAMALAAQSSIDMSRAQGAASDIISTHTGAEAGIVTSGASAGLLLGAAACLAGMDAAAMGRLPDTTGMRNEFVVPHSHRNSYDHAVRAAGGRLVEAGMADTVTGVGVRDTEAWELEAAITPRTAALFYVARPGSSPGLAEVAAVAHRHSLPLLVDAAAELPPASNLRHFISEGADLVVFSGGKALGGPMASGILCGRRALVASALLQQLDLDVDLEAWSPPSQLFDRSALKHIPRHGIGRSCKVGKEQIVGLLMALQKFVETEPALYSARWAAIAQSLADGLRPLPQLRTEVVLDDEGRGVSRVRISVADGVDARALALHLQGQSPSIRVDASRAHRGVLQLIPTCLREADTATIAAGFARALR